MINRKRPGPPDDHLQEAGPLWMIICKRPVPPYDHLQEAGACRWSTSTATIITTTTMTTTTTTTTTTITTTTTRIACKFYILSILFLRNMELCYICNVLQHCTKLWIPHTLKESFIWLADIVTCWNYPSELQSLLEPYKFLHENHFLHFPPKRCFCCKQFSLFLKIVVISRTMVPNIFRKLRVGLTELDIKLRKLIQSVPIYHFSV